MFTLSNNKVIKSYLVIQYISTSKIILHYSTFGLQLNPRELDSTTSIDIDPIHPKNLLVNWGPTMSNNLLNNLLA